MDVIPPAVGPARRHRSRRHHHRRRARRSRVALLVVLGFLAFPAWALHGILSPAVPAPALPPAPIHSATSALTPAVDGHSLAARRIYPYSVVRGGVQDRADVRRAIAGDAVVAAHYAGVAVDRLRADVVTTPRAVHVSYRIGSRVYWTKRTLMLHPGETLLSDGAAELRARCGNRVSEAPVEPTLEEEPTPEVMEEPIEEALIDSWPLPTFAPPLSPPLDSRPIGFIPPVLPALVLPFAFDPHPRIPPVPQVPAVPEPSTILLIGTGLAGVALRHWRRRSR